MTARIGGRCCGRPFQSTLRPGEAPSIHERADADTLALALALALALTECQAHITLVAERFGFITRPAAEVRRCRRPVGSRLGADLKAPRKYSALLLAVACIIAAAYTAASRLPAESGRDSVGSSRAQGIVDPGGCLPLADLERFDDCLAFIRDESNIDIRLVSARPTSGSDISAAALDAVDRLGVGRDTKAQQGLLLYFDLTAQRLKVEVGHGLEEHIPDAYVAFLVDRHASFFFANANRSLGLRQLLRLLHARIHDATLGGRFDPSPFSVAPTSALSGSAGTNGNLRDRTRTMLPTTSAAASFSAGMSPAERYASYIDLPTAANWNPDADLLTGLPQGQGTLPLSPSWIDVRPTRHPAVQPAKTPRTPRSQLAHANSAASPPVPRHGRSVRAMRRGSSVRDCAKPMRPSPSESRLLARTVHS
jgi:hypothetical protein